MSLIPGEHLSQPTAVEVQSSQTIRIRILTILLQISHRLGSVALLAMIGTWAVMFTIKDFHVPLAITAISSEIGLCAGLIARKMTLTGQPARREANGVTIFNLVLFVLALQLMLFARLEVIRVAASEFFTPSPQSAPHG